MKLVLGFMLLFASAQANWDGALSILPDLAFVFKNNTGFLVDTTERNNFTVISEVAPESYFPGIPKRIQASAYLLPQNASVSSNVLTAFFRGRRVFINNGVRTQRLKETLQDLFDGRVPKRVDAAYSRVEGTRNVTGTSFIRRKFVFECGRIGSSCTRRKIRKVFRGLPRSFIRDGRRIYAALGLPNGQTMLIKESRIAVIDSEGVINEGPFQDFFRGDF